MSGSALVACSAVALCLGLPIIASAHHLESRHHAGAVADAAALAAADAVSGWNELEPCEAAEEIAVAMGSRIVDCAVAGAHADVRIVAEAGTPPLTARARAHAAAAEIRPASSLLAPVNPSGWAWPADRRHLSQGFHDGFAIDLEVEAGGALYAPFHGVVVASGPDGGGIPPVCQLQAQWWHGPNSTVVIRHDLDGRTLYSSHNHIDPRSPALFGVSVGTPVMAGQRVASAGMSGCTSGPHTHFTLSSTSGNTNPDIDPFDYIGLP